MVAKPFEISAKSRRLLGELARTSGVSMGEVLDAALESYRRHMFVQRANADLARMRQDDQGWREYRQELAMWDATLSDGLQGLD